MDPHRLAAAERQLGAGRRCNLRSAAPAEFMTRSLAKPQVHTVLDGRSGGSSSSLRGVAAVDAPVPSGGGSLADRSPARRPKRGAFVEGQDVPAGTAAMSG
jgi:hypothetical protein